MWRLNHYSIYTGKWKYYEVPSFYSNESLNRSNQTFLEFQNVKAIPLSRKTIDLLNLINSCLVNPVQSDYENFLFRSFQMRKRRNKFYSLYWSMVSNRLRSKHLTRIRLLSYSWFLSMKLLTWTRAVMRK